ncbi:MAG: endolytic transglycosylase MltG [bacterium]
MRNTKKAAFALILIIIVLAITFKYFQLVSPVVGSGVENGEYVSINIETGSSGREIARKLYKNDLIRSEYLFYLLLRLEEDSLKAGTYHLNQAYDMHDILDILLRGRVATFRVTIPEGYTVQEISTRLAELTPHSKEDFLEIAKRNLGREYLQEGHLKRKYLLEGFLYPSTYIFPFDFSPEQIFEHMVYQYENRWLLRLESNYLAENPDNRVGTYTPYEIITIASLIEKEAKIDQEKSLIAAVIYNRLEQDMLLQIDASVQYALGDRRTRLLYRDLEFESHYNTYRYPGLPPGPIANPGSSSIEAALNPVDEDYLFYFARSDGSHVFTNSYSEHLRLQNEMRD